MAGITNSWIEQYTTQPTPCITNTPGSSSLSSCLLWLVIGLVLGSVTFQKKGSQQ
jgi:hypothetical protein